MHWRSDQQFVWSIYSISVRLIFWQLPYQKIQSSKLYKMIPHQIWLSCYLPLLGRRSCWYMEKKWMGCMTNSRTNSNITTHPLGLPTLPPNRTPQKSLKKPNYLKHNHPDTSTPHLNSESIARDLVAGCNGKRPNCKGPMLNSPKNSTQLISFKFHSKQGWRTLHGYSSGFKPMKVHSAYLWLWRLLPTMTALISSFTYLKLNQIF